jgi:hypothetical protein
MRVARSCDPKHRTTPGTTCAPRPRAMSEHVPPPHPPIPVGGRALCAVGGRASCAGGPASHASGGYRLQEGAQYREG